MQENTSIMAETTNPDDADELRAAARLALTVLEATDRALKGGMMEPVPAKQLRPHIEKPADVLLSDEAVEALSHHPFTSDDLRLLLASLNDCGMLKLELAAWWGYHPNAINDFLRGDKWITESAAWWLREIFGVKLAKGGARC